MRKETKIKKEVGKKINFRDRKRNRKRKKEKKKRNIENAKGVGFFLPKDGSSDGRVVGRETGIYGSNPYGSNE